MAVKASPENQAALLDLQALDTRIAQLDYRARNVPELPLIAELQKSSLDLRSELRIVNGQREDLEAELARIESDVSVVEARIARDTDRLQSSSSVKDVAGLELELVALRRRHSDLEEIEFTVMERLEEKQSRTGELRDRLEALQQRESDLSTSRDATLSGIESERSTAATRRQEIGMSLPVDLFELYERQRIRYGTGASLLRGGISQASGVKLQENEMQAIRTAAPDDVIMCGSSEAILVRTSESGL